LKQNEKSIGNFIENDVNRINFLDNLKKAVDSKLPKENKFYFQVKTIYTLHSNFSIFVGLIG
jgi:hypothetical protein